jgi:RNA polymerase sigma factor (sigma-70 family)
MIVNTVRILSDNQSRLIEGCKARHRTYQSELYKLYAPKMMIVCMRYAKNIEEAEEILQDGFIRVFKFIEQFKQVGSLEAWIRKIMVNCALQKLRNQVNLRPVVSLDQAGSNFSSTIDIIGDLSGKEMLKLIQKLSPAYRMVFNLYHFEGLKHREIAILLKIEEGTSKSNLAQAKRILQNAIIQNIKIAEQNKNG